MYIIVLGVSCTDFLIGLVRKNRVEKNKNIALSDHGMLYYIVCIRLIIIPHTHSIKCLFI